ncbi:MAG: hypothetical protein ACLR7Z_12880 [Bilophila wadsworthia]
MWLKREDCCTPARTRSTRRQALLAKHMGKTALVAETGAGQHGVATAAAAARLGLECIVSWVPRTWSASPPTCGA